MKVSRQSIADFYKIHQEKGKAYTYNNFKTSGYSKAGIYKIMSKFDEMGNVDRKSNHLQLLRFILGQADFPVWRFGLYSPNHLS